MQFDAKAVKCETCVCGSVDVKTTSVELKLRNTLLSFATVQCDHCDTVFFHPMPSGEVIKRHYSDDYNFYSGNNPKQYGRGVGFARYYLRPLSNAGKILDVGCGAADFLNAISQTIGWEVYGVDINQASIENASKSTGLKNLIYGDIFDSRLDELRFDCIHLRDVIEHVVDPVSFVSRARSLLSDQGFIYVRIPNGLVEFKGKIRQARKNGGIAETLPGHIWYISIAGFQNLCEKSGLQIVSSFSFGLKNGLRNLGFYPVPKTKSFKKSRQAPYVLADFSKIAEKSAHSFCSQEANLWKGLTNYHLEHVYILKTKKPNY